MCFLSHPLGTCILCGIQIDCSSQAGLRYSLVVTMICPLTASGTHSIPTAGLLSEDTSNHLPPALKLENKVTENRHSYLNDWWWNTRMLAPVYNWQGLIFMKICSLEIIGLTMSSTCKSNKVPYEITISHINKITVSLTHLVY